MKNVGFVIVLNLHSNPPCFSFCCNVVFANECHVLLISNNGSQITEWSVCLYITAREQLRRARHSRTFLVESGTGELWSEMQKGKIYLYTGTYTHIGKKWKKNLIIKYSCHLLALRVPGLILHLRYYLCTILHVRVGFLWLLQFPLMCHINCDT